MVTWDVTEYECECWADGGYLALGDYYLSDPPFYLGFYEYGDVYMNVWTYDPDASHTIRIERLERSRISPKVLPDYLGYGAEKRTVILPEQSNIAFAEEAVEQ